MVRNVAGAVRSLVCNKHSDTSSVIAAAALFGDDSAQIAIILKLVRTLWLIPLLIFAGLVENRQNSRIGVPWFVIFFVSAAVLGTALSIPDVLQSSSTWLSQALLVITLLNWHRDHSSQLFKLSRRGSIPRRVAPGAYRDGKFISYYEDCLGDCPCYFILSIHKACWSGNCDTNRSEIELFPAISSENC